jgi:cation transport ATPase
MSAFGKIPSGIATSVMTPSSISVIANSALLERFKILQKDVIKNE